MDGQSSRIGNYDHGSGGPSLSNTDGTKPSSSVGQSRPIISRNGIPGVSVPPSRGGLRQQNILSQSYQVTSSPFSANADRPLTQQGIPGVPYSVSYSGRQVMDKSFWLTELRSFRSKLISELTSIRRSGDKIQTDGALHFELKKKYDRSCKDVKEYQNVLSDFNSVLDLVRYETPTEDMKFQLQSLIEHAGDMNHKLNAIFSDRQESETQMKGLLIQITDIQRSMESRINELAPEKRKSYSHLQEKNATYARNIYRCDLEIKDLHFHIQNCEEELRMNSAKHKAIYLYEQIGHVKHQMQKIREEEAEWRLSPDEMREKLLRQVKQDNLDISRIELSTRESKQAVNQLEGELKNLTVVLGPRTSSLEKSSGVEDIKSKDEELRKFVDNFPSIRAQYDGQLKGSREMITQLLEAISSQIIAAQRGLPSQKKFQEIGNELKFKEKQMINSISTQTRLEKELSLRKNELLKMNTLQSKIDAEMSVLSEKINGMTIEIPEFLDIRNMKRNASVLEKSHLLLWNFKKDCLDWISLHNISLRKRHEAKHHQLIEINSSVSIEQLEHAIRSSGEKLQRVVEVVSERMHEANFALAETLCQRSIFNLNTCCVNNCHQSAFVRSSSIVAL